MGIFDSLTIPLSTNHLLLVKYILTISLLVFIPFLGMVIGAAFISVYFSGKGKGSGSGISQQFERFSRDVLERLTITKYASFAMGVLPLISVTFAFAELLQGAKTIVMGTMLLGDLLLVIGFIAIYSYRGTFFVEGVLNSFKKISNIDEVKSKDALDQINEYEENLHGANSRYGKLGLWTLLAGAYMFVGSTTLASSPESWPNVNNVLQVVFSMGTIFNFLYFLSVAGVVTGGAILFYFFQWQGGMPGIDEHYGAFIKDFASRLTLVSAILLPLFIFMKFLWLPDSAQSPDVFLYMVITLVLIIILCNFVYTIVRNSDIQLASVTFFLIFMVLTFNIIKDQTAMGNALSDQTKLIAEKFEKEVTEERSKTVNTTGVDPDAIFNSKCIACHRFDVKLVGPPYNQTVPTFNGDVNKLADIIFSPSPTPLNAGYPTMPNQGLKKKEALAMAKWLIDKVGAQKK